MENHTIGQSDRTLTIDGDDCKIGLVRIAAIRPKKCSAEHDWPTWLMPHIPLK
jgi:hypothetical protein